jgi:hypothetical protein
MTIGHVTFQPAHLSDAGYYQDKAAECEERAYWSQLPDVQALYRNLAAHWLELARNAQASNHPHGKPNARGRLPQPNSTKHSLGRTLKSRHHFVLAQVPKRLA